MGLSYVMKFLEKGSGQGEDIDPTPKCVKDIRSFLGHASFYHRFIKDFRKIARPLTNLLAKEVTFIFDDECLKLLVEA